MSEGGNTATHVATHAARRAGLAGTVNLVKGVVHERLTWFGAKQRGGNIYTATQRAGSQRQRGAQGIGWERFHGVTG